jgi:hypothetical protein
MQPSSATSVALEQLLARLDVEQDELAIASVAATRAPDSDGLWQLAYGSLLFGVQEMANTSWLGWRSHTEAAASTTLAMLSAIGLQEPDLAQFIFQDSEWLMARLVLPGPDRAIDTAAAWLEALLGKGVALTDATGGTHLVQAQLAPADALVLGCRHDDSRLQRLTRAAQRPVLGYRFPRENPVGATVPQTWRVGSSQVALPLYQLLGIGAQSADDQGLVIGRAARTAWLAGLHMDDDQQLHTHIGFDPERVALGDLEIDLEEYAEDGLIQARRLRLADLRLPATKPGDAAEVVLPTLGSKISHQVRLYARSGRLLDATARNHFVSQINMAVIEQQTGATTTLNIGGTSAKVTTVTRLARLDEAEREYRRLLDDGLTQRIFDNTATAISALQQMLVEARGHLLVLDPYFGHKSTDWDALDKVTVPVKVLAQHKKPWKASPRPVAVPDPSVVQRHSTGLALRSWDIDQAGRSAPWHDRVYLWQHGGLTVGTSPSGLGGRLARVDRLSPVEAAAWEARFNVWWTDPLAIVVR